MASTMRIHTIVLGTAGHIDHGKSSLVRALTNIDPDRLPEEKSRGLTIDLGFARWDLAEDVRVGIVDVPGHERFIKNMVAGASGIDFVLLVVAADDGVMPQTREHLDIMSLLGLERGAIAVTKIDLVDEDLRELVIEEVRELVQGTFLAEAPIFPVSVISGEGVAELRTNLARLVLDSKPREAQGAFRMPVQRVFSAPGFGTVLTGIPVSGKLAIGDKVVVLPGEMMGRVRGLEAYRDKVDEIQAGHSSAINISDLDYRTVERGMTVAAPGVFEAGTMFEATFRLLERAPGPMRHLTQVRFHTGTAEVIGRVALLQGDLLQPGEETYVQIRLDDPLCACPGDRFVLRLASPLLTLGGGKILQPSRFRIKRSKPGVQERLERAAEALADQDAALILELDALADDRFVRSGAVARKLQLQPNDVEARLQALRDEQRVVALGQEWASTVRFDQIASEMRAGLDAFYEGHAHRRWMELRDLRPKVKAKPSMFDAVLAELVRRDEVVRREAQVCLASRTIQLTADERAHADRIAHELESARFSPPTPQELVERHNLSPRSIQSCLEALQDEGQVALVAPDLPFAKACLDEAGQAITENIKAHGELVIPDLRDRLGTSRKFLIPMLDYFDRIGLTLRQGGRRILKSK
ncbi:MAG: selenocysteine-specific translation elongation factor [Planctomycetes bacterium]|nr:selenocysteine-specific translation elongation factor [Planctomycetota bacterium]